MQVASGAWRFKNEQVGRPYADAIYKRLWDKGVTIEDFRLTDHDKLIGVDVGIRFTTGQILYAQEKFLSYDALKYGTLTIEYMQNPQTDEQGDWYKLGVQLYLAAYLNEEQTGFADWILINWTSFILATWEKSHLFIERQNKRDGARASFKAIRYEDIPKGCIVASHKMWSE